jgi:hypothetical protein
MLRTLISSVVDKLDNGSLLYWLVSQPQHEAVVVPCRPPIRVAATGLSPPWKTAAKILRMNEAMPQTFEHVGRRLPGSGLRQVSLERSKGAPGHKGGVASRA